MLHSFTLQSPIYVKWHDLLSVRLQPFIPHKKKHRALSSQTGDSVNYYKPMARASGIEHLDSRPYQVGDESRHIDWRASAKKGHIYTKTYHPSHQTPVHILTDQSPHTFFGSVHCLKSVYLSLLAAALGQYYMLHKHPVGGAIFNAESQRFCSPKKGQKGLLDYYYHLIKYNHQLNANPDIPPAQAQDSLSRLLKHLSQKSTRGLLVLLTDFSAFNDYNLKLLKHLASRSYCQVELFVIFDPLEAQIEAQNTPFLLSDHQQTIAINPRSKHACKEWRMLFQQKQADIQALPLQQIHFLSTANAPSSA